MGIHSEVPYVISIDAGAEMRSVMGVAVFSGMIGVTFFGIFMMRRVASNRALIQHKDETAAGAEEAGEHARRELVGQENLNVGR